jgi:hypothetical protein
LEKLGQDDQICKEYRNLDLTKVWIFCTIDTSSVLVSPACVGGTSKVGFLFNSTLVFKLIKWGIASVANPGLKGNVGTGSVRMRNSLLKQNRIQIGEEYRFGIRLLI